MANKRMFSLAIIDTDKFLDMPASAQALYFQLGMRADDEGFVSNPKRIQKLINAAEDDLKILESKEYIYSFDSGVVVVVDWYKNNNKIKSDRFTKTIYQNERMLLKLVPSSRGSSYAFGLNEVNGQIEMDFPEDNQNKFCLTDGTEMEPKWRQDGIETEPQCLQNGSMHKFKPDKSGMEPQCLQNGTKMEAQNRSEEIRLEKNIYINQVYDFYNNICHSFSPCKYKTKQRDELIEKCLKDFSIENIKTVFEIAEKSKSLKSWNWKPGIDWFLQEENMIKCLEGNYTVRSENDGCTNKLSTGTVTDQAIDSGLGKKLRCGMQ